MKLNLWRRLPLRGRLLSGYLLVILTSIGLVALIVNQLALVRLDEIELLISRRRAFQLAPFFADYYRQTGSWAGVARWVDQFQEPLPPELMTPIFSGYPGQSAVEAAAHDRLILTGLDSRVIVDSLGLFRPGQTLSDNLADYAVTIQVSAQPAGQLLLISELDQTISTLILTAFRRTLLSAALVAGGLTTGVSLLLAHDLLKPIQSLNQAARRLASEDMPEPLPVETEDELGQLTQSFNEMVLALNQQKWLRRQMMADIAHELRTPLSIMQLELEGWRDGLQSSAEATASLSAELGRLSRLIEDLRLLSLADAGAIQFKLDLVDPAGLLWQVVERWQVKAQSKQVKLIAQISPDLPAISADEGRLAQALNNLIDNALRYSLAGQTVEVGAKLEAAEVMVWVADQGPGIAGEHLPYIFERFYRTESSRSRDTGGSGLGLAISKQWVVLHHGRIWAESEVGVGTTIYLALPV